GGPPLPVGQLLALHRLPGDRRRRGGRCGGTGNEMKTSADVAPGLSALDRPNSYIGRSVPRPNLARLTQGRAQFVSDVVLPRMAHVAFVRSPHAHARITALETAAAKRAPGVIAVVTTVIFYVRPHQTFPILFLTICWAGLSELVGRAKMDCT